MIKKNYSIKQLTSFKIGGVIDEVFFPQSSEEFINILENNPGIKVFGNLSNTLISTFGYSGKIVITNQMSDCKFDKNIAIPDCGLSGVVLSMMAANEGFSGLEFMRGFPGSVGGEVFMNASANSQSVSDTLIWAKCYSVEKGVIKLTKDEMDFGYRTSRCQKENLVVLQAAFELKTKPKNEIYKQMEENLAFRKKHQPSLALPNCGSIFKNPSGDSAGRLLESVGAKNMFDGRVKVWENHANFIVNTGDGTSLNVLSLMYKMQKAVEKEYNIKLEPEIRFLGSNSEKENELWEKIIS